MRAYHFRISRYCLDARPSFQVTRIPSKQGALSNNTVTYSSQRTSARKLLREIFSEKINAMSPGF